jgi:ATP-dependent exoDNAse (exonuclease V) beta subunit
LTEDLADREIHQDPGSQVRPGRPELRISPQEIKDATSIIANRWTALKQETYTIEAMKEVALRGAEPPREREGLFSFAAADTVDERPAGDANPGEHGVEWGEDIHVLLDATMRDLGANLERLARSLTREREDGDEARVKALVDCVQAVQKSTIWKRARASTRVFAEIPLMSKVSSELGENGRVSLRRGVIDLVFWEKDGWVIVDYKTDQVKARSIPERAKHYSPQVKSYAYTWQTITGEPVHEVGLFFTRVNHYEPVHAGRLADESV